MTIDELLKLHEGEWRVLARNCNYAVSRDGRVARITPARGARVGRILRSHKNIGGYPTVVLYCNNLDRPTMVHILVAEEYLGPRPDGYQINHIDGDKSNNCADNLEYVTRSENQKHAYANGLNHTKKAPRRLSDSDRCSIAESHATADGLACRFGVSRSYVYALKKRKVAGNDH